MTDLPLDIATLRQRVEKGESFDYFFFWGHTPPDDGSVNKSCFSQWFPAPFSVDDQTYPTAEHWMMAEKARLFEDDQMLSEILDAPDPKTAKALGRKVKDFEKEVWDDRCFEIVRQGNIHKFQQNELMKDYLLSTSSMIIVETAPRDRIWGIGMGQSNENATNPLRWRGRNLLGFVLTEVREMLLAGQKES